MGLLQVGYWALWFGFPFDFRFIGRDFRFYAFGAISGLAAVPIYTLFATTDLAAVLNRLRGERLDLNRILRTAFAVLGGMLALMFIEDCAGTLLYPVAPLTSHFHSDIPRQMVYGAHDLLLLATALVPTIIIVEKCSFRRALTRFGTFLYEHLWRYAAFVFLAALTLGLADCAWVIVVDARTAANGPIHVAAAITETIIYLGLKCALQLVFTVMCFEFYLTKAGTADPVSAETADDRAG